MGKLKKKFIDKKNAVTFYLVHRSQHDPLIADENAPQHVLMEAEPLDKAKQKEEQKKFGVFFDDDYDYLQHMKLPGREVVWECVAIPNKKSKEGDKKPIQLPSSVFASEFEEQEGLLNKAAPNPGPKPDWDPDIVAALDEDFDFDNPDNELEDDFVAKAMGDDEDEDDDGDDESDESGDDENSEGYIDSDGPFSDDENEDEIADRLAPLMRENRWFDKEETKSRFTEYSMSSSVIRRNEQLTLLDDRFEKFFSSYDDPELGALDLEEIEGEVDEENSTLLNMCKEFKRSSEFDKYNKKWDKLRLKKFRRITESDDENDLEEIEVKEDGKKWDCESILSTNSTLYNHPKIIEEPRKNKKLEKIEIDPKTGIPKNILRGNDQLTEQFLAKLDAENSLNKQTGPKSLCDKSVISTLSVLSIRPKDETPEEKRERKRLLKEYRMERRVERKANAEAFKEEKKRQQHIKINNQNNLQGKKIV